MSLVNEIKKVIEKCIDEGKDVAIYPMGDVGIRTQNIMKAVYGITPRYRFDNKLCKYNKEMYVFTCFLQLGYKNPRIVVSALNPHASESGLFGDEEAQEIEPAIEMARKEGLNVEGPEPPDTVFVKCQAGQYDIVVAMYHDQGHIPLKLNGFNYDHINDKYESVSGINCTIGLPIVRTSVDHGTAFGKAGEGRANEESMIDAIFAGIEMAKNKKVRRLYG